MRITPIQLAAVPTYNDTRGKDYRAERLYPAEESLGTGLRPSEVLYYVAHLSTIDSPTLARFRQWVSNYGGQVFIDSTTYECLVALDKEKARRFEAALAAGTDKDVARAQIRADAYAQLLQAFKD